MTSKKCQISRGIKLLCTEVVSHSLITVLKLLHIKA